MLSNSIFEDQKPKIKLQLITGLMGIVFANGLVQSQSRYYVHFRANTLGKGMNPLILPPAMGN